MKQFETVPIKKPALNVFNLSHDVKASYNFDKLYPFLCHPVNPGETFNVRAEVFMRTMPLLAPVMHNVDMYFYFFFVPNRLLWNEKRKEDWKTFITGGEKGDFGDHGYKDSPSADYVLPHFNYAQLKGNSVALGHGSLLDHLGFPTIDPDDSLNVVNGADQPISSLPFRAYQLIWNEYFRNQNVQNEIEFSFGSGLETNSNLIKLTQFRKKCWEKDYFTSCLPWQQRGEAVLLPFTTGSVQVNGQLTGNVEVDKIVKQTGAIQSLVDLQLLEGNSPDQGFLGSSTTSPSQVYENVKLAGTSTATSGVLSFTGAGIGTITDFRYCLRLQQWLENNARCGSRYIEQILAHFGVMSSDSRLQRPELLGGGKVPLIFSDVPQTSADSKTPSGDDSVQGNLAGKGMLYGKTGGFKKYFEEHGIILGICCIIPRTSYQQGIPRYWRAMDKTDFYFPEFAHLSEQAVLNSEIYYNPTEQAASEDLGPDGVFGYQGRFVEYRYIPSTVHGELRNTLQYWHFGRTFPQLPRLNSSFVSADTRANVWAIKEIAEGSDDPFIAQLHLDIKAVRPMPKFAVPSL